MEFDKKKIDFNYLLNLLAKKIVSGSKSTPKDRHNFFRFLRQKIDAFKLSIRDGQPYLTLRGWPPVVVPRTLARLIAGPLPSPGTSRRVDASTIFRRHSITPMTKQLNYNIKRNGGMFFRDQGDDLCAQVISSTSRTGFSAVVF